ncbi:MAG: metallophosphoesterase [Solobacterium sp.]|nr:metallophosphoesterase [Solobacterium sp.]
MEQRAKQILSYILSALVILSILAVSIWYDVTVTAPKRYQVRYETLSSVFIPEQMNDVTILYFSDLDYGTYMDEERLSKLTDTINSLSPDVILFGGDLFDQDAPLSEESAELIQTYFSSMRAPLGKFAVLGDFDYRFPELPELLREVLFECDFELLVNSSVLVRNGGSGSITITGLDSGLYGNPDISAAFANVGRTGYNIVLSHTPDLAEQVPVDLTNYMIAGHSHGGQVYWGVGALYTPEMAELYFRGKHDIDDQFILDISNGVGTTIEDKRFLANAEVVLYRLKHNEYSD